MSFYILNKKVNREEYVLSECEGRKVLHIGCLGADKKAHLHNKIIKVAREVYGIDLFDSNLVNFFKMDAQYFSLNQKFDLILAGEVIEHLWNIEGFVNNLHKHLEMGGKAIITTPNAYAPIFLKRALIGKRVTNDKGHVLLFDITTLKNLLDNFCSEKFTGQLFYYFEEENKSLAYKIQRILEYVNKSYCRGIIVELIKINNFY